MLFGVCLFVGPLLYYIFVALFSIVVFYEFNGFYSIFIITVYATLLSILKILFIFIIVAFFTLVERKVLGAVHRRRGPALVGIFGLLQPIADALKLFVKELLYPLRANTFIFLSAP